MLPNLGYGVMGWLKEDPNTWDLMVSPSGRPYETIAEAKKALDAMGGPGEDATVIIVRLVEEEVVQE